MIITGPLFRDMCISAANALENNKEELNNLNVFPVPDGDTGINMSMTLRTLSAELKSFDGSISECAEKVARVALRAARGNSGVILSLFFRGLAKELHGLEEADSIHMARAFKTGVAEAYRAVMTPTEGTILTVMRVSAERAIERAESDFAGKVESLFAYMVVVAIETLQKTPELLPALKLANVVDAGGAGFVKMIEGMLLALQGSPVELKAGATEDKESGSAFEVFSTEDIKFGYCTECIVDKAPSHRGEGTAEEFRQLVMSIGDSVVFVDDEEIIKVHVHTNNPDRVLAKALMYGDLATVKIENMRNQHSALLEKSEEETKEPDAFPPEKPYGFVTVCMGDGMKDMFEQLSADRIVFGGQTMNPSMEQMLEAIRKTPAETVFVLPNNKNIYMVSEQAAAEVSDRRVIVLGTRSIPEGIAAMLAFDEGAAPEENEEMMKEAVAAVTTLQVTYAVREFSFEGESYPEGKALGLKNGKIVVVADSREECIEKLAETLDDPACITVFCGAEVDENGAEAVEKMFGEHFADAELTVVSGGQPLYDFVVSVE